MGKRLVIVTLVCLLFFGGNSLAEENEENASPSSSAENESSPPAQTNEEPASKPEVRRNNFVTIDLSQCTCTGNSNCELTILKSPVMDLTCGEEESLCCPVSKSDKESGDTLQEDSEPAEVAPKSNVRVYTITPSYFAGSESPADKYLARKSEKSKKCACKARNSCPQKYVDYGFGFYCSYSTVRCCIPEDDEMAVSVVESEKVQQPNATAAKSNNATFTTSLEDLKPEEDIVTGEKSVETSTLLENNGTAMSPTTSDTTVEEGTLFEKNANVMDTNPAFSHGELVAAEHDDLSADGELVIKEVTSWTDLEDDEYQKESECYCLPLLRCQELASYDNNNMIERRRDTLCPGELIQCCGRNLLEEITKKRDEIAAEYDLAAQVKSDEPQQSYDTVDHYPAASSFPTTNATDYPAESSYADQVETARAPIVLEEPFPGYQPPGFYKGYGQQQQQHNLYSSGQPATTNNQFYRNDQQQQLQPLQPHPYQQGMESQSYRPWLYSKYVPAQVPAGTYAVRNDYSEGETPRHKPGGLFDTLTKLLG